MVSESDEMNSAKVIIRDVSPKMSLALNIMGGIHKSAHIRIRLILTPFNCGIVPDIQNPMSGRTENPNRHGMSFEISPR